VSCLNKKTSKGSDDAPLVFVLVAGAGFEPATSGPRDGNSLQRLFFGYRRRTTDNFLNENLTMLSYNIAVITVRRI
jgi:hypothetical protein